MNQISQTTDRGFEDNEDKQKMPLDKTDVEGAKKLVTKDYSQVKDRGKEMLTWLQDGNWPVAPIIGEYLGQNAEHLTEEIREILNGEDEEWKYWVLIYVVSQLEETHLKNLETELLSIKVNPNDEGSHEIVEELLHKIKS